MQVKVKNAAGEPVTYDYGDRYSDPNRKDLRRSGDRKKGGYQIAEMWERHHEIARMIILGMTNVAIANEIGCSAQLVSNVRNSPVVKDQLSIMKMVRDTESIDLSREIRDLAPIALQRVKEALTEGKVLDKEVSASGILKEANGLLDREMGRATQRIDTRNAHVHFSKEDLDAIKAKARAMAMTSDQLA